MSAVDYKAVFIEWSGNLETDYKPNEWEVKKLLQKSGLTVPDEFLFYGEMSEDDEALASYIARTNCSYVVKLCSPEILHKTDVGGVALNIPVSDLPGVLKDFRCRFGNEHLLISTMKHVSGPEFILGAVSDPVLGPAVMIGAGGILTELYKDVSFRLAPCTANEAGYMLGELVISPVLSGYRGSTMEIESLKNIISVFSMLAAAAVAAGAQIDINPLVWDGEEWVILDAKAVLK